MPLLLSLVAVIALLASALAFLPTARADAGEGTGLTSNGEFHGSYDIGEANGGGQVWCADYGKAEPMAGDGGKYGPPERIDGVSPEDVKVLTYALQEGKRAVDEGNKPLAAAVSAVIHAAGTNKGLPFDESKVPAEAKADFDRIRANAPEVPEGTFLTLRTPEGWTPGGKEGYQRVLDYDQVKVGVIEVVKVDAVTGKPLAGSEFALLDSTGKPVIEPQETKADGAYRIQVNPGEYEVVEGRAPQGYLLGGDGSRQANSQKVTVNPNDVMRVTFANRPMPTITVTKTDDAGKPLAGAKMRVTDDKGKKIADFVSDERPVVIRVMPGSYKVEELEAPEGFVKEPEVIDVPVAADESPEVSVVNVPEVTEEPTPEPEETIPTETTAEEAPAPSAKPIPAPQPWVATQAELMDTNLIEEGGKIIDHVQYGGLKPGTEYTLRATTVCHPDGRETGNDAEVTFTPEAAEGEVDVPIEITDAACDIQTVFEELVEGGKVVAEHKDVSDQAQTVGVTKPVPRKPRVIIQSIPSGTY